MEPEDEYEFTLDPKLLEFLMAFGKGALRIKSSRQPQPDLPTITDLAAAPLSTTSVELTYFANVAFYQYRIDSGSPVALSSDTITGLTEATEYDFEIRGGHLSTGPWSEWSNLVTVSTLDDPEPVIGNITNWATTAISQTALQGSFTPATNSYKTQGRHALSEGGLGAANIFTLNASNQLSGLTENTLYYSQVRGRNEASTEFGSWSNIVSTTTLADEEEPDPDDPWVNPINYLTAGEKAQLLSEYGISTIPFTRKWGLAGEPQCLYREPTYNTGGSSIPANALDISAYSGNVATWLAAMETQQKPGKAGPGTYNAAGLVTRGTQSIYGYGVTRPIFTGAWRHYVQADNCRFQYLKRTNSEFWIIVQDNSTGASSSTYGYSYLQGAAAIYKRAADHTGLFVLDCEFDNVYWAIFGSHGNYRTKKFHIGRNTYRNGCKIIASFGGVYFGDANVTGGNGHYWYGNDLEGAVHYPSQFNQYSTSLYTIMGMQHVQGPNRATNGPLIVENNRVVNVIGIGLPKTQQNICVVADLRESDTQFIRYNEVEDVYTNLYASDCNAFYCKGSTFIEENYIRNTGSSQGQLKLAIYVPGRQDANGWNTDEGPGTEGQCVVMKGGGGYPIASTVKNNICIPMFDDTNVIMSGHRVTISGNYIFNWHGKSVTCIRTSHPGQNCQIGPNYFVGCKSHPYDNRRMVFAFTAYGGGGTQANASDDILNTTVNFDNNRRDLFWAVQNITNSFNGTGQTLLKATTFAPMCHFKPTVIRSGGNFVINSPGAWNISNGADYLAGGTVTITYEWYRDGVIIAGQTASSMSESQWTGTIEGVVVGTVAGKSTRCAACPPFHKIISELVPGGPATFADSSSTTGVTQDYALGALTVGDKYRFTFNQNVNISTFLTARITGTGGVNTRGEIHANSRAGTFAYEFVAKAGENNLRFTTAASSVVTLSNISCGKITGAFVMGQAW